MTTPERFDVWLYFPDDFHERVGEGLDAEAAVRLAHNYTTRPAARVGIIRRVQIVARQDDATVFLWEAGRVTFPRPEELEQVRTAQPSPLPEPQRSTIRPVLPSRAP